MKVVPWKATWIRQEAMIENQKRIIELLEELNRLLDEKMSLANTPVRGKRGRRTSVKAPTATGPNAGLKDTITKANFRELQKMCSRLGLPARQPAEVMRKSLLEHHGL